MHGATVKKILPSFIGSQNGHNLVVDTRPMVKIVVKFLASRSSTTSVYPICQDCCSLGFPLLVSSPRLNKDKVIFT